MSHISTCARAATQGKYELINPGNKITLARAASKASTNNESAMQLQEDL